MSDEQCMVTEFHRAFDVVIGPSPSIPDEATCALRVNLMQEEFNELREALAQRDVEAVAKELADVLYVVYGTAVSCGIDMASVFREVHRSNMSKVGGHKRADGKWLKPPDYSPAHLRPLLAAQGLPEPQETSVPAHVPPASEGSQRPFRGQAVAAVDRIVAVAEVGKGEREAPGIHGPQLGRGRRDLEEFGAAPLDLGIA